MVATANIHVSAVSVQKISSSDFVVRCEENGLVFEVSASHLDMCINISIFSPEGKYLGHTRVGLVDPHPTNGTIYFSRFLMEKVCSVEDREKVLALVWEVLTCLGKTFPHCKLQFHEEHVISRPHIAEWIAEKGIVGGNSYYRIPISKLDQGLTFPITTRAVLGATISQQSTF